MMLRSEQMIRDGYRQARRPSGESDEFTFQLPNLIGELVGLTPTETPFLSTISRPRDPVMANWMAHEGMITKREALEAQPFLS